MATSFLLFFFFNTVAKGSGQTLQRAPQQLAGNHSPLARPPHGSVFNVKRRDAFAENLSGQQIWPWTQGSSPEDRRSSSKGDLCNSNLLTPPGTRVYYSGRVSHFGRSPGRGVAALPRLCRLRSQAISGRQAEAGGPAAPDPARVPARLPRSPGRCSPSCGKAAWSSWLPTGTDPPKALGRQEKILEQHGVESASHTLLWEAELPALSHVQFIPLGAAILGNGAVPVTWAEEAGRACALCLAACPAVCGCASFLWEVDQRKTSSVVFLWAFLFCFVWGIFHVLSVICLLVLVFVLTDFFSCLFFWESHIRRMRRVGRGKNMIKLYCMKKLNKKEKDVFIIKEDKAVVIS